MATYVPLGPLPFQFQDTVTSDNMSGGTLEFYLAGTSTPTNLFSDNNGTSIGTSITLNSGGMPESGGNTITLWRDVSVALKLVLKNAAGATISTSDNIPAAEDLRSAPYYAQTQAEIDAGVTPSDTKYAPRNIFRYGATGEDASADTGAVQSALSAYGVAEIPWSSKKFYINDTLVLDADGESIVSIGPFKAVLEWHGGTGQNFIELQSGRNGGAGSEEIERPRLYNLELQQAPTSTGLAGYIHVEAGVFHPMIEKVWMKFQRGIIDSGFYFIKFASNGGDSYPVHPVLNDVYIRGGEDQNGDIAQYGLWFEGCIEFEGHSVFVYDCYYNWHFGPTSGANQRQVADIKFYGGLNEIHGNISALDTNARNAVFTEGNGISVFGTKFTTGVSAAVADFQQCLDFQEILGAGVGRAVQFFGCEFSGVSRGQYMANFADPNAGEEWQSIAFHGGKMHGYTGDLININSAATPDIWMSDDIEIFDNTQGNVFHSSVLRVTALSGTSDTLRLPIAGATYQIDLASAETATDVSGIQPGRRYSFYFNNGNCTLDFSGGTSGLYGNGGISKTMPLRSTMDAWSPNGTRLYCNINVESVQTYTLANDTTDRSLDADSTTTAEVADVLATLIRDLEEQGVINV